MNLPRAKELIAQIEEAQGELAAMFAAGGGTPPYEPHTIIIDAKKAAKTITKLSTTKGCGECGSIARHKKTCSKSNAKLGTVKAPLPGIANKDPYKYTHAKTRPQAEETEPLSEDDFDAVHEEFLTAQETQAVARALGLPLMEVNRAMGSTKYQHYLDHRDD